jgi:uncharacterized membrane-anchored protein
VRRAVARFPSVVVGEVVEAIITPQTDGVDALVILGSPGKVAVAIETWAEKPQTRSAAMSSLCSLQANLQSIATNIMVHDS